MSEPIVVYVIEQQSTTKYCTYNKTAIQFFLYTKTASANQISLYNKVAMCQPNIVFVI